MNFFIRKKNLSKGSNGSLIFKKMHFIVFMIFTMISSVNSTFINDVVSNTVNNKENCEIPRKVYVESGPNQVILHKNEKTKTIRTSPKQQISCDVEIKNCPDLIRCYWDYGKIPGSKKSNTKCVTYVGDRIIDFNSLLVKYNFRFEGCDKGSTTCYNQGTIYVHISKDENPISRTEFLLVFLFVVLFIIVLNFITNGIIVDFIITLVSIEFICSLFREPDIFSHVNSSFTGSD